MGVTAVVCLVGGLHHGPGVGGPVVHHNLLQGLVVELLHILGDLVLVDKALDASGHFAGRGSSGRRRMSPAAQELDARHQSTHGNEAQPSGQPERETEDKEQVREALAAAPHPAAAPAGLVLSWAAGTWGPGAWRGAEGWRGVEGGGESRSLGMGVSGSGTVAQKAGPGHVRLSPLLRALEFFSLSRKQRRSVFF